MVVSSPRSRTEPTEVAGDVQLGVPIGQWPASSAAVVSRLATGGAMESTTEMRWWWRGGSPPQVDAWFAQLRGVIRDEARTDRYLALATDLDMGVKVRGGERLEIKALSHRERDVAVSDTVVGTLEQWLKWSFALAAASRDETEIDQNPGAWIRTCKYRWLVDVEDCALELAEVDVGEERWWSLAAEAAGTGDSGRERLAAGLRWLVAAQPPPQLELTDDCSYGYAELLARRRAAE